jgi:hypothetical protein
MSGNTLERGFCETTPPSAWRGAYFKNAVLKWNYPCTLNDVALHFLCKAGVSN